MILVILNYFLRQIVTSGFSCWYTLPALLISAISIVCGASMEFVPFVVFHKENGSGRGTKIRPHSTVRWFFIV